MKQRYKNFSSATSTIKNLENVHEAGWVIFREEKFSKACRQGDRVLNILHAGKLT